MTRCQKDDGGGRWLRPSGRQSTRRCPRGADGHGSPWRRGRQDGNSAPGGSSRWEQVTYAFTGTGSVGSVTGNGSRDFFLDADGVHPTAPGSRAFAIRQAATVRKDLQAIATA